MNRVVLVDPARGPLVADPSRTDATLIRVDQPWPSLHVRLAALGPLEEIVDIAGPGAKERVRRLVFHLRPGGRYVVEEPRKAFVSWLETVTSLQPVEPPRRYADTRPSAVKHRHALAASLRVTSHSSEELVIEQTADAVPVLPAAEVRTFLAARHGGGSEAEVIATRPAGAGGSETPPRASDPDYLEGAESAWQAPELLLTSWSSATCLPRGYALAQGVVLPASFASNTGGSLSHVVAAQWAPLFHQRVPTPGVSTLEGTYLSLDNTHRGHFGHVLTEELALAWAWPEVERRFPDARILVSRGLGEDLHGWELELLAAAGLPADRFTVIDRPVTVERLLTATPAFARPDYVHAEALATYERVGAELSQRSTLSSYADSVFLSRRGEQRACRNAGEVEDLYRDLGYQVIYPEEHSLADQVALVRGARRIAGLAGSNMFHLAFSARPQQVTVITQRQYPAHNERLLSAAHGHDLRILVCGPEVAAERFTLAGFHSGFSVDLARDASLLRAWAEPD